MHVLNECLVKLNISVIFILLMKTQSAEFWSKLAGNIYCVIVHYKKWCYLLFTW